jgi:EpsG-like putative glucosyltransferase
LLPYWFLFSLCAAGALQFRPDLRKAEHGGPLLLAAALLILLMIGFRYEVGGDWLNYMWTFQRLRYEELGEVVGMRDPAYAVLNWSAHRLGADIWFVNLVCAAVFIWGFVQFVRQQPNPWLAVVAAVPYLIIVVAMGYTRQAVAIGFILAGMARMRDRQSMLRFGMYVAAAAVFHRSAIVILPLVALAATKNRLLMVASGTALAVLLYYQFLDAEADRLFNNYITQDYDSQGAFIRVAMNIPPAALFLLSQSRFRLGDFERKLWRNFAIGAFVALGLLMVMESSTIIDRLALYLIPLQLMVFSRLPMAFPLRGKQNGALTVGVIGYSALVQFVWLTEAANARFWVPYHFWPINSEVCHQAVSGCFR